jgi:probable selenium-dependent hydroxylase accessory protein YqeC
MWRIQETDPLELLSDVKYVSFTGSGGKTSFMEYSARRAQESGRSVAITTTTKIFVREPFAVLDQGGFDREWKMPFVRVGNTCENGKLTGLAFKDILHLGSIYDLVLIEADGAKGMPLKAPAAYEPVVPPFSEKVFVLCGLDALGGRVEEKVFRWELFRDATGTAGDAVVTPELLPEFFADGLLLKGVDASRAIPVLNKYDVVSSKKDAMDAAKGIIRRSVLKRVLLSSVRTGIFYSVAR